MGRAGGAIPRAGAYPPGGPPAGGPRRAALSDARAVADEEPGVDRRTGVGEAGDVPLDDGAAGPYPGVVERAELRLAAEGGHLDVVRRRRQTLEGDQRQAGTGRGQRVRTGTEHRVEVGRRATDRRLVPQVAEVLGRQRGAVERALVLVREVEAGVEERARGVEAPDLDELGAGAGGPVGDLAAGPDVGVRPARLQAPLARTRRTPAWQLDRGTRACTGRAGRGRPRWPAASYRWAPRRRRCRAGSRAGPGPRPTPGRRWPGPRRRGRRRVRPRPASATGAIE